MVHFNKLEQKRIDILNEGDKKHDDRKRAYNNKDLVYNLKSQQRRVQRSKLSLQHKKDLQVQDTERRGVARTVNEIRERENAMQNQRIYAQKTNHLLSIDEMNRMDATHNFTIPTNALEKEILYKIVHMLGIDVLADKSCMICDMLCDNSEISSYNISPDMICVCTCHHTFYLLYIYNY